MEAKELMVGDLVLDCDNRPVKIRQILKYRVLVDVIRRQCFGNIKPIPLTAEILEKNRWFEIFKDKYEGHISLAKEETTCFRIKNTNICLRFVHELQHALRLVGLNEVADNLKV